MADREFYLIDMRYRPGTEVPDREWGESDEDFEARCGGAKGWHWHTSAPLMVFWAPDSKGYANSLRWAGRYRESELAAHRFGLGTHTLAVPCEVVERFSVEKPDPADKGFWCDGPGPIVPNHALLWDVLVRAAWQPEVLHG